MEQLPEEQVYLAIQEGSPPSRLIQLLEQLGEVSWTRCLAYSKLRKAGHVLRSSELGLRIKHPSSPHGMQLQILGEWDWVSPVQLWEQLRRSLATLSSLGLMILDDEWDAVYYQLERFDPRPHNPPKLSGKHEAILVGARAALILEPAPELEAYGIGVPQLNGHGLSLLEAKYLLEHGYLRLRSQDQIQLPPELVEPYRFYRDLTDRGYLLKSGLKFGVNFRIYDRYPEPHSKYLLQLVEPQSKLQIQQLARAVRLAHSVRKRLILGFELSGQLCYLMLSRLKL